MLRQILFFSVIFFISQSLFAQDQAETYLWNNNYANWKISDKYSLTVGSKVHYKTENQQLDYRHADIRLFKKITQKLSFGLALRNSASRKEDRWLSEIRPMIYGNYTTNIKTLSFKFVNRIGYRMIEEGDAHFRYLNFMSLSFTKGLTKLNLRPYVSEEIFIKLNEEGTHMMRFYGGVKAFDFEHFDMAFFYCRNLLESGIDWNSYNVAGINLYFQI